jgi:O-antigen ligase
LIRTQTAETSDYDMGLDTDVMNMGQALRIVAWVLALWVGGAVLHRLPPIVAVVAVVGLALPAVVFFWQKPAYGIVALMFFASGFLEPDFIDVRLPIGGGFEMRDILVLLLFGILLFQRLNRKSLPIPWMPVGLIMALFFCVVFFSLLYALFFENVASNWALGDARILSFYLLFFIVGWSIRNRKTLLIVIIGCFVIADLTAAIVILQQQRGAYNLLLESMRDGSWQIADNGGVIRVVPPGILLMYYMNLISLGLTIFVNRSWGMKIFLILHSMFLTLALIFTYTRSAWVASGIALAIIIPLTLFHYRRYISHIFILGTAIMMFVIGTIGLIFDNPSVENEAMLSIINRFNSIFTVEDTLNTNSLQWRVFESQQATKAVLNYPLTGVGLGNSYRPVTVFQGEAVGLWTDDHISYRRIDRFTRYVHTSYLAITVKLGLPGIILLLGVFVMAILKGLVMFFELQSPFAKGLTLPIIAGFIGMLQWSILHAHLLLASSTATNGLLLGVLASIFTIYILPGPLRNENRIRRNEMVRRAVAFLENRI